VLASEIVVTFIGEDCAPLGFRHPTMCRVTLKGGGCDQDDVDFLENPTRVCIRYPLTGDVPNSKAFIWLPAPLFPVLISGEFCLEKGFVVEGIKPGNDERGVENNEETKVAGFIRRGALFESRFEGEDKIDCLVSLSLVRVAGLGQYFSTTDFVAYQSSPFAVSANHPPETNDLRREERLEKVGMPGIGVVEVVIEFLYFLEGSPKEEFIFL
jgi:hypothetical protein